MKKILSGLLLLTVLPLCMAGCNSGPQHTDEAGYSEATDSLSATTPTPMTTSPVADTSGSVADTLQIIFPKGGERLIKGKTYSFKWTGGHDSTISIFLVDSALESKGASVSLTDRLYGIQNKGSYDYSFPDRVAAGTYKVQIGKKESGYFRVVKGDANSDK